MSKRMPVAFVPHAGGPVTHVDLGAPRAEVEPLATYWQSLRELPPQKPRAVLVVSAHWEARVPTVMSSAHPPMLFDYYGFPPAAYALTWPAPGDPEMAAHVRGVLEHAGFATAEDRERGFDHGTFTPLKQTYPHADVPVVQLSLKAGLDPAEHLRIGRALAPLRDEGVFVVGSGMSFHNMRAFFSNAGPRASEAFDAWLGEAVTAAPEERDRRLLQWAEAPSGRECHPREEHLLPLMVIAGAAGASRGEVAFRGSVFGQRIAAHHFA